MKRKPSSIVTGLINILNSLRKGSEYSINQIKDKTGFHWETIHDYIILLRLIEEFGPKIEFNPQNKKIKIKEYSKPFVKLNLEDQIVLFLFLEKKFGEDSSCEIKELKHDFSTKKLAELKKSKYFQFNSRKTSMIYLSKLGKFRGQGILSSIHGEMAEFVDKKANYELNKENREVIKPFHQELNPLKNIEESFSNLPPLFLKKMAEYLVNHLKS